MNTASSSPQVPTRPTVSIFATRDELGKAAAAKAAEIIRNAIARRGFCRILVATGNSQLDMVRHLAAMPLAWDKVDVYHMDEYVGISPEHSASFHLWVRTRFVEKVHPRSVDYLDGKAPDADAEARRYAAVLGAAPLDLAFVGFGENGHIAFNDPHVADFDDPVLVKRVTLDEACRRQQVGEGHFPDMQSVPKEALSVTCTGLFRAEYWVCCVPESRKAAAVRAAFEGPLSTACPASLVRNHPRAFVYLDRESAALLSPTGGVTATTDTR